MPRAKPPSGAPRIDPRWLGQGLRVAWAFNEGSGASAYDALNRLVATLTSSSWGSGGQGPRIVHDATTDRTDLVATSSQVLPTGPVTIILGSRKTDATNRDSGAFGVNTGTAAEYCGVKLPAADGTVYWDYGGVTDGTTRLTAAGLTFGDDTWGFTVGARGMEIWQSGILRASNAANPTRTASSSVWKLGLYDSTIEGDLAEYNCLYLFSGQLSQDDIALLTTDPSLLFLDQHAASRSALIHAGLGFAQNVLGLYEIIRIGRMQRAATTRVIQRAATYGFLDQQNAMEGIEPIAYIYLDQQHALEAVDPVSYVYTDQLHAVSIYDPTHTYTDQFSVLNAYEERHGFTDQQHALDAYTLSYGFTDSLAVLDAYTLWYGFADQLQALDAYQVSYGVLDQLQGLDAYTVSYGYTDGLSALGAYTVSYGYTDALSALQAPSEEIRGWTDQAYAIEVRALAQGYADQAYALDTYTLSYGYQDGQHALNAWEALYGFLDTLHALDARAVAYGYTDLRHAIDADPIFYGWVMNAATEAASKYEGFNFNSLCQINESVYLGASSAGIHELGGSTDAGTAIAAFILSGSDDFKTEFQKRVTDAYIAAKSDGDMVLKATADGVTDTYSLTREGVLKNRKIDLGRGRKGRYWQIEIQNRDGSDFTLDQVTLLVEVLSRRV